MKYKGIILLSIVVLFTALSCKKDSEGNVVTKMAAKVDGTSWSPLVNVTVLSGDFFTITSTSMSGEILAITIKGTTTGTYNLSILPPQYGCACTYKSSITDTEQNWFVSATGTVVLTKVDQTAKTISGTFEFTLMNSSLGTKTITNGSFNDLTYQEPNL